MKETIPTSKSKSFQQFERRRLSQVRKSFEAGISRHNTGRKVALDFLGACVDYIKFSMDRLHAQDQRIHDILVERVDKKGKAIHGKLINLNSRLAQSRVAVDDLTKSFEKFRATGSDGWNDFARGVDRFMDVYFNVLLKGQHSTLNTQDALFDLADWDTVAGITNNTPAKEYSLFGRVMLYAPPDCCPESFKGGPPQT